MRSKMKTIIRRYCTGHFYLLEQELNRMSDSGAEPVRLGRIRRVYAENVSGPYRYRAGCVNLPPERETYLREQAEAGWERVAEYRGRILFRKRAADCAEDEQLVHGRGPFELLYAPRIKRRETFRKIMVALGALMLIAGYVIPLTWLFYGAVAPLAAVIPATLQNKFMEEGLTH